ncbi:MAG: restriction endonuclease [Rhodanobacter sp.]
MKWKQYQEDVAELLRSLGFTATVEAKLSGARGVHKIDVHATQTAYGFPITWIVECKYWNKAVPKEKVLVLGQIAADIGADRGFLLSESGFQSGTVLASQNTNVTLTSLPDLRENTQAELTRIVLVQIAQRAYVLEKIAQRHFHPGIYRRADGLGTRLLELLARLFTLKTIALPNAQAGDFPVHLFDGAYIEDPPTFLAAAKAELETIAYELDALVAESAEPSEQILRLVETFIATVNDFLEAAQRALSASSTEEHGHWCMEAHAHAPHW